MKRALVTVIAMIVVSGCEDKPAADPRGYVPLPPGCNVQVFEDIPPMKTDNMGPVSARCSEDTPIEDCLRTLKDQACKLGGDVVWGVANKPEMRDGKMLFAGRAAHTKAK